MADKNPPKTLIDHLNDVKAIASIAASRAEIAVKAADSADLSARETKAKLDEMTRLTPNAEGRPGILPWIASELAAVRADMRPVTHFRMFLACLFIALVAGFLGGRIGP